MVGRLSNRCGRSVFVIGTGIAKSPRFTVSNMSNARVEVAAAGAHNLLRLGAISQIDLSLDFRDGFGAPVVLHVHKVSFGLGTDIALLSLLSPYSCRSRTACLSVLRSARIGRPYGILWIWLALTNYGPNGALLSFWQRRCLLLKEGFS